jgi:hypothetical protein
MQHSQEEETILRAILISSSTTWSGQAIAATDRQAAFGVLNDFSNFSGRIPMCLQWLPQPQLVVAGNDCTLSAKLYACELLSAFLKSSYNKLQPQSQERLQLRHAVLQASQIESIREITDSRILANKLASLLAAILVREFPQRWTTCMEDLFRLWSPSPPKMGNKICLEVLKLVAEDCTDSDFNSKVRMLERDDRGKEGFFVLCSSICM